MDNMYLQLICIRRPQSYQLSFASDGQNFSSVHGPRYSFLTDQLCMVRKKASECFGFGIVVWSWASKLN